MHHGMLNFTYSSPTIWLNFGIMLEHLDQEMHFFNLTKVSRDNPDQINSSYIILN